MAEQSGENACFNPRGIHKKSFKIEDMVTIMSREPRDEDEIDERLPGGTSSTSASDHYGCGVILVAVLVIAYVALWCWLLL